MQTAVFTNNSSISQKPSELPTLRVTKMTSKSNPKIGSPYAETIVISNEGIRNIYEWTTDYDRA